MGFDNDAGDSVGAGIGRGVGKAVVGEVHDESGGLGGGGNDPGGAVIGLREIVQGDGGGHFGHRKNVGDRRCGVPVGIAGLGGGDGDLSGAGEGQVGETVDLRRAGGDGELDGKAGIGGGGEGDDIGDPLIGDGGEVDGLIGGSDDEHAVGPPFPLGFVDGAGHRIGAGVGRGVGKAVIGDVHGESGGLGGGGDDPGGAVIGLREIVQGDGGGDLGDGQDVGDGRGGGPVVITGLGGRDADFACAGEDQVGEIVDLRRAVSDVKGDGQTGAGGGGQGQLIGSPLIVQRGKINGLGVAGAGAGEQQIGQGGGRVGIQREGGLVDAGGGRPEDRGEIGGAADFHGGGDAGEFEACGAGAVGGPSVDVQIGRPEIAQGEEIGPGPADEDLAEVGAFGEGGRFGVHDGRAVGAQHGEAGRRSQQERARLAVVEAAAGDFVVFVDAGGIGEHPAGAGSNQVVEVGHDAVAPEKGLVGAGAGGGGADDPGTIIDGVGVGTLIRRFQGAQVAHEGIGGIAGSGRILPCSVRGGHEKGMAGINRIGDAGPSDGLSEIVDIVGLAVFAGGIVDGQRTQKTGFFRFAGAISVVIAPDISPPAGIGRIQEHGAANHALLIDSVRVAGLVRRHGGLDLHELVADPPERIVNGRIVGGGGGAGEFTLVIDGPGPAFGTAPGADGGHEAVGIHKAVVIGRRDVRISRDLAVIVDGAGDAGGAAGEKTEAGQGSVRPDEGLNGAVSRQRPADDLAVVVQAQGGALGAAEGAEINGPVLRGGRGGQGGQDGADPDDMETGHGQKQNRNGIGRKVNGRVRGIGGRNSGRGGEGGEKS